MRTIKFPKIGLDVDFVRTKPSMGDDKVQPTDSLAMSVRVPAHEVQKYLALLGQFKERIQYLPGLAPLYGAVVLIENSIVQEMEE
jgi:hypothetical protein